MHQKKRIKQLNARLRPHPGVIIQGYCVLRLGTSRVLASGHFRLLTLYKDKLVLQKETGITTRVFQLDHILAAEPHIQDNHPQKKFRSLIIIVRFGKSEKRFKVLVDMASEEDVQKWVEKIRKTLLAYHGQSILKLSDARGGKPTGRKSRSHSDPPLPLSASQRNLKKMEQDDHEKEEEEVEEYDEENLDFEKLESWNNEVKEQEVPQHKQKTSTSGSGKRRKSKLHRSSSSNNIADIADKEIIKEEKTQGKEDLMLQQKSVILPPKPIEPSFYPPIKPQENLSQERATNNLRRSRSRSVGSQFDFDFRQNAEIYLYGVHNAAKIKILENVGIIYAVYTVKYAELGINLSTDDNLDFAIEEAKKKSGYFIKRKSYQAKCWSECNSWCPL